MQIIIPMTGYGSRFVAAGYKELKPMIPVLGIPIIEWIVKGMYDVKKDTFLFVCRNEHFVNKQLDESYLYALADNVSVIKIDDWVKLGPVYDILRVKDSINDDEPCIVNYCDFFTPWDWAGAKNDLLKRGCDGAVMAFSGFQPCLVPKKNVYASCLCDDEDNLIEIREKHCFCEDKFNGRHSTGTYYFKNGALLKHYYQVAVEQKALLNGEYYASLPYNFLVSDGLKVWVPIFEKQFYTWGTPEDLREFELWVKIVNDEFETEHIEDIPKLEKLRDYGISHDYEGYYKEMIERYTLFIMSEKYKEMKKNVL